MLSAIIHSALFSLQCLSVCYIILPPPVSRTSLILEDSAQVVQCNWLSSAPIILCHVSRADIVCLIKMPFFHILVLFSPAQTFIYLNIPQSVISATAKLSTIQTNFIKMHFPELNKLIPEVFPYQISLLTRLGQNLLSSCLTPFTM